MILGQSVGVIEFIDIGDIAIAPFCGFKVADIVNTKTQAFRQIVAPCSFQLFTFYHLLNVTVRDSASCRYCGSVRSGMNSRVALATFEVGGVRKRA